MAEIAGLSFAAIAITGKIAKNLYIFIHTVGNSSGIRALHKIVLDVKGDIELIEQLEPEIRQPHLITGFLRALESLKTPLNEFDGMLRDLHRGQPTPLILAYRYGDRRDELEAFERLITSAYRSLHTVLLAIAIGRDNEPTDRAQPLPPYSPPIPQTISPSELLPCSRQLSNASTLYGEPASELFRATEKLKVKKVKELLDAGASIHSRDSDGRTLVDIAVTLGRRDEKQDEMVYILTSRGAKFTCKEPTAVQLFREIESTIRSMRRRRRR